MLNMEVCDESECMYFDDNQGCFVHLFGDDEKCPRIAEEYKDYACVLYDAIKTFGAEHQRNIAVEEMSELIKELMKNFRGEYNLDHIAEEIADVEIMIAQLKIIYDCDKDVDLWKEYKTDRLKRTIAEVQHG